MLKYFELSAMEYGPPFREDGRRTGDPKNQHKSYPLHVSPPVRYYTGVSEGALQPWLGVEQSNISKYLDLAADIPRKVVASPKFLTGLPAAAKSASDMTGPVPHLGMLADGTHIPYKKRKKSADNHFSPQPVTVLVIKYLEEQAD